MNDRGRLLLTRDGSQEIVAPPRLPHPLIVLSFRDNLMLFIVPRTFGRTAFVRTRIYLNVERRRNTIDVAILGESNRFRSYDYNYKD